ncbi:OsmC family protein [Pseudoxanthomonas sp. 10H]|uniref:OsmC family protein n=1 Tax=Pseudoxanthomonas sp. 10H TaxID=3242729 RepID=UPI00355686F8
MDETRRIGVTLHQDAADASGYAFRVAFDDTAIAELSTDESPPLGQGAGPDPSRLLLAAVANCLSASLLFALRKFHNHPGPLVTHAVATLARNAAGRWRVAHIHADLRLAEPADGHTQVERLLAQFEDFCIVTESVRQGVPVSVSVSDARGNRLHGGDDTAREPSGG